MNAKNIAAVSSYLRGLQDFLIDALRSCDPAASFREDTWAREEGGGGIARVLSDGRVWEKVGVNFSDVQGEQLPPSATKNRPDLAGAAFRAMGVSLVFHPLNPHVPTTHMNVRFFTTLSEANTWWFGGGFDLTPYYPWEDDAISWHQAAKAACDPFGEELYPRFKSSCDRYFFLAHRNETRGIGGLFFDDFNELGFERSFAFTQSVGEAFWPAYELILKRRMETGYSDRERQFQLYRRGRYVEFNLLQDRGTLFGIQSKGRTESILMSMPPLVRWEYGWEPEPGSPEEVLYRDFLHPRDWLGHREED